MLLLNFFTPVANEGRSSAKRLRFEKTEEADFKPEADPLESEADHFQSSCADET